MDIIERMRNKEDFTASEQVLINLILTNPDIMLNNPTTTQLAAKAYTSASTMVRLCQKLGCSTFAEFKTKFIYQYQLRENPHLYVDANLPFSATDTSAAVLDQLSNLEEIAIRQTRTIMNLDSYDKAIRMLNEATCIDIYGSGGNVNLFHDFSYKMGTIHHQVHLHTDRQNQILSASTRNSSHCAILISYSGETRDTLYCAKLLQKNHTPTISITSQGANSLTNLTDLHLYIASLENKTFGNTKLGTFTSNISISTIMNYLFAGVFQLNYSRNYQYLLEDRILFLENK